MDEYGSIERELHIEASPEVVFEVVSRPEHLKEWWSDDATLDPGPDAIGELVFGDEANPRANVVPITVVDLDPPRRFTFRWDYPSGEVATEGNSLQVTFELTPANGGTNLRLVETGFREKGWEVAVLEERYADHVNGWNHFIPRLGTYATALAAAS